SAFDPGPCRGAAADAVLGREQPHHVVAERPQHVDGVAAVGGHRSAVHDQADALAAQRLDRDNPLAAARPGAFGLRHAVETDLDYWSGEQDRESGDEHGYDADILTTAPPPSVNGCGQ